MTTGARRKVSIPGDPLEISLEERHGMIAVGAYFLAEKRGFAPGCERQDWLQAAAAIDQMLDRMRSLRAAHRRLDAPDRRNALRLWEEAGSLPDTRTPD